MYSEGNITYRALPLPDHVRMEPDATLGAAEAFLAMMRKRHSIRDFTDDPVDEAVIRAAIATAGTAPSGANHQPWHFVAIRDPEIKAKIRGLNAAKLYGVDPDEARCVVPGDLIGETKVMYEEQELASPSNRRYGPTTRREFFSLLRSEGFQ